VGWAGMGWVEVVRWVGLGREDGCWEGRRRGGGLLLGVLFGGRGSDGKVIVEGWGTMMGGVYEWRRADGGVLGLGCGEVVCGERHSWGRVRRRMGSKRGTGLCNIVILVLWSGFCVRLRTLETLTEGSDLVVSGWGTMQEKL